MTEQDVFNAMLAELDPNQGIDPEELAEREQAAQAYAGEEPEHFVEYLHECMEESKKATEDIRDAWDECWRAYQSDIDYSDKEDWQSKAVTPEPFMAVQQAKAIVRKAFNNPRYYSIEGVEGSDKPMAEFVKEALDFWLAPLHASFAVNYCDATEMALAIGLSHEVIPLWDANGLRLELVEPWKIYRDPDARARDPWSGMYWIHEEWMDLWQLKEGQRDGVFINVDNLSESESRADKEKEERRKGQYWTRNKYRKGVQVREFWGTVLDSNGELLLPSCRYTVAGDEVIRLPQANPYVNIKWPGSSFSPFVHLLRYEGKGILENVISLWWLMNNILNLHTDDLNWVINKIREIDPSKLANPTDTEIFPGAAKVLKNGAVGPAMTIVGERSSTADVLPNLQFLNQKYENGTGVNAFVAGLPGERSSITLGETKIKTQQSLGLFDSIGSDLEFGAVNVIYACYETIMLNWTGTSNPSPERVFADKFGPMTAMFSSMPLKARRKLLEAKADIKVSGISAQLKQIEAAQSLQYLTKMVESSPRLQRYAKPYQLLQANAEALNQADAKWIATEDERKLLDAPKPAPDLTGMAGGPGTEGTVIPLPTAGGTNAQGNL